MTVIMISCFLLLIVLVIAVSRWIVIRAALKRRREELPLPPEEAARLKTIDESGWDPKKRA